MKPSVILYKTLPDDLLQRLEEHFSVTQVKNLRPETVSQHAEAFAQAEGLLGSSEKVDAALLEKMPKLRATSTVSVGYDNFDVEALNARRVLLMHTALKRANGRRALGQTGSVPTYPIKP